MANLKVFVAESVSAKDFYNRDWEGRAVEEIVRLLSGRTSYRIVMTSALLRKAIESASEREYDIFHLSCHGDREGIQLTDKTEIDWNELADLFQEAKPMPRALILSSCVGGDSGIAHAFKKRRRRPNVIFGAEASGKKDVLTFPGACISWPILYTELLRRGMSPDVFKDAINKMNSVTPHQFVYRRWNEGRYLRYPPKE
jgi:hypothetical protein